jgi:hypothetical protein
MGILFGVDVKINRFSPVKQRKITSGSPDSYFFTNLLVLQVHSLNSPPQGCHAIRRQHLEVDPGGRGRCARAKPGPKGSAKALLDKYGVLEITLRNSPGDYEDANEDRTPWTKDASGGWLRTKDGANLISSVS